MHHEEPKPVTSNQAIEQLILGAKICAAGREKGMTDEELADLLLRAVNQQ